MPPSEPAHREARPVLRALFLVAALAAWSGAAGAQTSAGRALPDGWLTKAIAAADSGVASSDAPAPPTSAPPSYSDYFPALGYSFTHGLAAKEQIAPLAIGTAGAVVFLPIDAKVSEHLRTDAPAFHGVCEVAGSPITLGALGGGLIAGSLATDDSRFRSYAFTYSQGLILAETLTAAVKLVVRRERPDRTSHFAFPSGHAAGAFALATVSAHYYGAKAGVPLYALASLVALSRVTSGKHFPSDVIAGATIGYISARAAVAGTEHVTSTHASTAAAASAAGARGFSVTLRF